MAEAVGCKQGWGPLSGEPAQHVECLWTTPPQSPSRATHVSELHEAQLAELAHTGVGSSCGQEELDQRHLLTPEHGAHGPGGWVGGGGVQSGAGHRQFPTG